ncbi:rhodanese-like domain-containing protein [Falsiroseomonas ponticola]|uniref:rhodanese-like domain-containing protein n=1 Tax=Falsiroseomonas ponticola TaxID=2786951 RepID=UPI0019316BEA|nr:rhodanese-like domain-containing protein [Roseomonas ponticola]
MSPALALATGDPPPSLLTRRAAAIAALVERARGIERAHGVTRAGLGRIADLLIALAQQEDLFPADHFPPGPKGGAIYRLAKDADGRFALYASVHVAGPVVPPHDHGAWAIIAGVRGVERNTVFHRRPGATPGTEALEVVRQVEVGPGGVLTLLPEEVHSLASASRTPALHLHFYGLALDRQHDRVRFPGPEGGRPERFGPPAPIRAPLLPPQAVKAAITDGEEIALLDLREEGAFAQEGHPLFAVPAPLSRLEGIIAALVPRRSTRIVLTDGDGTLLHPGATRLARLGYWNVAALAGGLRGWAEAGYEVFTGTNVPSKAFGEVVEQQAGTPHLGAEAVHRLRQEGRDLVVLDSRPLPEFRVMSIPGALDCPGAELVLRAREAAPDPATLVVVNCAGRTRSIIGAQALINAGLPNPVAALENGTMGWEFAGLSLAHGETASVPPPGAETLAWARDAAATLARRLGLRRVDAATIARWQAEDGDRTTYFLDVRSPEEYRAGHLPGFRSAPGGQLVQATDAYVGTLRSRIVLADGEGVRAPVTAAWLIQMGWTDVVVLEGGLAAAGALGGLEVGPERRQVLLPAPLATDWIDAPRLRDELARGATVFDIGSSRAFRAGHIPGAWFTTRTRLIPVVATHAPSATLVVITATEAWQAALAAQELAATGRQVRVLLGGLDAWRDAGFVVETGGARLLADDDVWLAPAQHPPERQAAEKRRYLDWEFGLPAQIERDGDARFRVLRPSPAARQGVAA